MLTSNLIKVRKQFEVFERLRHSASIHFFLKNLSGVVRRVEAVVKVHNPHDLVFLCQQARQIHGLLHFKGFTLFIGRKIVAGNRVPILPFCRVANQNFFQNRRELRFVVYRVVEIDQQVIDFLLVVIAVITLDFFGPFDGRAEIIDALVEDSKLPLLLTVWLAASLLPLLHVFERLLDVLILQVDLGNIVIGLRGVFRRDVALVERRHQVANGALTISAFDVDIGGQFENCAFLVAIELHRLQLAESLCRGIEVLVRHRGLFGLQIGFPGLR